MSEAKRPKCDTCKSSYDVHLVARPGQIPGAALAHRWLCGSCEYAEMHADAARVTTYRKPHAPQAETLW